MHSRKRGMRGSTSALGLDKMIDEKRDAKTMSERVVHIEVRRRRSSSSSKRKQRKIGDVCIGLLQLLNHIIYLNR